MPETPIENTPENKKDVAIKPLTPKEKAVAILKKYFPGMGHPAVKDDPDYVFRTVVKNLSDLPDDVGTTPSVEGYIHGEMYDLLMATGVGTQFASVMAVPHRYRPLFISFTRQLVDEYKCDGPSQIAIAEVAASAYVRIIKIQREMESMPSQIDLMTPESNRYYSILSKDLDRAERHFITAVGMLKHMNVSPVSVKINAQNAFIADKQQFNKINDKNNEAK